MTILAESAVRICEIRDVKALSTVIYLINAINVSWMQPMETQNIFLRDYDNEYVIEYDITKVWVFEYSFLVVKFVKIS